MAGKALSSARMSDAVLSQSSLMGSQQFQDGENEGKSLDAWGTLEKFLEGPFLHLCQGPISSVERVHREVDPPHPPGVLDIAPLLACFP